MQAYDRKKKALWQGYIRKNNHVRYIRCPICILRDKIIEIKRCKCGECVPDYCGMNKTRTLRL